GYPLVLRLREKEKRLPSPVDQQFPYVTVLLVVCNEEKNIETKLHNLLDLDYPEDKLSVLVVDDASEDQTLRRIALINSQRIGVISVDSRLGKPNGLNLGMAKIDSELVLMVDARQTISESAVRHLVSWFQDGEYGLVSGELSFHSENENDFSKGVDAYWRYEKMIRKAEASIGSVPGVTGAIYMIRRAAFQPIPVGTLIDDVLIPMQAIRKGYRVGYDERAKAWDVPSSDVANEKRRKVRTLAGNYQLMVWFPSWIFPGGHPIWWQFLSHKILRLAVPFMLLVHVICSCSLATNSVFFSIYFGALIMGLLSYPVSLYFKSISKIRVLRIISSFVALNWFNFLAFV
ncbi:glycosyltransferase family 2 protein, partial [Oleiphilus sp. HI0123]